MHKRLDFFIRDFVYYVRLVNFRSFPSPQGYAEKLEPKSCLACYQSSVICLLSVMVNDLDPPPRAIRIVCSVCRTVLCVTRFCTVIKVLGKQCLSWTGCRTHVTCIYNSILILYAGSVLMLLAGMSIFINCNTVRIFIIKQKLKVLALR
jgi:hypothetical protein